MLAQDLSCVGSAGVSASVWAAESEKYFEDEQEKEEEKGGKKSPVADEKKRI